MQRIPRRTLVESGTVLVAMFSDSVADLYLPIPYGSETIDQISLCSQHPTALNDKISEFTASDVQSGTGLFYIDPEFIQIWGVFGSAAQGGLRRSSSPNAPGCLVQLF